MGPIWSLLPPRTHQAPVDDGSVQYSFSSSLDSPQVEDMLDGRTERQVHKKVQSRPWYYFSTEFLKCSCSLVQY